MNVTTIVRRALAAAALTVGLSTASEAQQLQVLTQQVGGASSGQATLQTLLQNPACSLAGSVGVTAGSLTLLPPPGAPIPTGGTLLILPDATFAQTLPGFGVKPLVPGGSNCQALFNKIPIPVQAAGLTLHVQGIVVNPLTSLTATSNAVSIVITP